MMAEQAKQNIKAEECKGSYWDRERKMRK